MSWSKSDKFAVAALIVSIGAAWYSYSVADNARLDAKRQATRSDSILLLDAAQNRLEFFNCHFIALGNPVDDKDPQLKQLVAALDTSRQNLALIDRWDDHEIDSYRAALNVTPASFTKTADELIRKTRANLDEPALAKIDRVCRLDG